MTVVALVTLVGLAYFCGMVDVSHRDVLPYGLVVTILVAAALYHKFGVTV